LGPLLSVRGHIKLPYPGGCGIGNRPIDLHIQAMSKMGANVFISNNYIHATAERLVGTDINLTLNTVTGTQNIISAAVLTDGITTINNAAIEPEITDQINYLIKMGADIKGAGTRALTIRGVRSLRASRHKVIPDRIEAATFMVAAAAVGGSVELKNVVPEHVSSVHIRLQAAGATIVNGKDAIEVYSDGDLTPVCITTLPYPGFPTDIQAQFMAAMCRAKGISIIEETIFENRFHHVKEFNFLGAQIYQQNSSIVIIDGVGKLCGATVSATDIRAGAALIIAGLMAEGETIIKEVHYIDRGYERIEEKFKLLGADINRVN